MVQPQEQLLERKKKLFDAFECLYDSDEEQDSGRRASEAALRKSLQSTPRQNGNRLSNSIPRATSAIDLQYNAVVDTACHNTSNARSRPGSPAAVSLPQPLTKSASDMTSENLTPKKTLGKRKRATGPGEIPQENQVFKGLHFFFFPNNNVNPPRRMRIAKAIDYGAVWHKVWDENVSHVIVDRPVEYSELLRFLGLRKLPENVVLVSENYPAECIAFRSLIDAKLSRFGVKGYGLATSEVQGAPMATAASLQLKRAIKPAKALSTASPEDLAVVPATLVATQQGVEVREQPKLVHKEAEPIRNSFPESTTELDDAIKKAKSLQHVPLDDEEADSRPNTSEGPDSSNKDQCTSPNMPKQPKRKTISFQDKFSCMQKHTGEQSGSPNLPTINILEQMADYYYHVGDEWRVRAYRKAITTLRNHPTKVYTKEEALSLPNVGDRLATKIEEIAFTNRLRRLDSVQADPKDQILQTFMKVYGAGFATASRWVSQGFTTLDELLQKADLTDNQRIGIHHYADFNTRIPRAEVERHGNRVCDALQKLDPTFELIIGGSYRRGASSSGDIDCIITRPNTNSAHLRSVVLDRLVPQLLKEGFLVASLAITSKDDGSKWHGASCLPGSNTWRRLDLLLVPSDELGAALIYFTGNDIFNRSLRLLASTKGMVLNQRGLYRDVIRGKGRQKITEGTLVEGKDEKRVFEVLNVPWRPPEHRVC